MMVFWNGSTKFSGYSFDTQHLRVSHYRMETQGKDEGQGIDTGIPSQQPYKQRRIQTRSKTQEYADRHESHASLYQTEKALKSILAEKVAHISFVNSSQRSLPGQSHISISAPNQGTPLASFVSSSGKFVVALRRSSRLRRAPIRFVP